MNKPASRVLESIWPLFQLDEATALRVARAAWRQLSIEERALITVDWPYWFRENQFAPPGDWRSWGFLTGRGLGKTTALSYFINCEVEEGRAQLVGLCAQDEQSSKDIQINGPNGLIATAPPWNKPEWLASDLQLVWPNGACAYVRTPEVPGKIRGLEYHLFWASELQSWPVSTREESWDNVEFSTRLGAARILWDATRKRRHPILKAREAENKADPARHILVKGATYENAANLAPGFVKDLERKYKGTIRGREELFGEDVDDSEFSLVKQAWIDAARRPMPESFVRKVVSIDPAVSSRKGSDTTGLVLDGLGHDGQGYVLANATGKYAPAKWAGIALDWYIDHDCDLLIAETNKGGDLVAETVRLLAKDRDLEVVVIPHASKERPPRKQPGKVIIKEVYARGAKEERAEPVATAYERGRISHVIGADLESLEDTLTTWEPKPGEDSPGDLDAHVHAMIELLDLNNDAPNAKKAFQGIAEVQKKIVQAPNPVSVSSVFATAFRGMPDRLK